MTHLLARILHRYGPYRYVRVFGPDGESFTDEVVWMRHTRHGLKLVTYWPPNKHDPDGKGQVITWFYPRHAINEVRVDRDED